MTKAIAVVNCGSIAVVFCFHWKKVNSIIYALCPKHTDSSQRRSEQTKTNDN